jgi:hypothetical protein
VSYIGVRTHRGGFRGRVGWGELGLGSDGEILTVSLEIGADGSADICVCEGTVNT